MKCSALKCKTQLSDGSPELCPKCQEKVCSTCKGHKKIIDVWHHGHMPRMKKCPSCGGTGKKTEKAEIYAVNSELVRKAALREVSVLLEMWPDEVRLQKLNRILANNHPNGTFQGSVENLTPRSRDDIPWWRRGSHHVEAGIQFTIIVGSQPVTVAVDEMTPVNELKCFALIKSKHSDDEENWQLKDQEGRIIAATRAHELPRESPLHLTLPPGIGG